MIGHYVSMALRSFRRTPFSTVVNVLTLAMGLACFLVAWAIVGFWERAEQHYPNADRTYVVTADLSLRDGSVATGTMPVTNQIFADYLKADFPEFEAVVRARGGPQSSVVTGDVGLRLYLSYAEPEFLDIFNLPFIAGDPNTALDQPDTVILTQESAQKLFGRTDVVGERLLLASTIEATVTGVVAPLPQPSHIGDDDGALLRFDVLANWETWERFGQLAQQPGGSAGAEDEGGAETAAAEEEAPQPPENWLGGYCCTTYILLAEGSPLTGADLNSRLKAFGERHVPPQQQALAEVNFGVTPVSGVLVTALNGVLFSGNTAGLSVTTLLFALGGLVLAVACLNYANLATAQASFRTGEVGLRKVVGANRRQVLVQHLIEAGLLTVVALVLAIVAVQAVVPLLRTAANIDLNIALFAGLGFWGFVLALVVGVTVVAGFYPAFVLSRVRPVTALRGAKGGGGPRFIPMLLVGVQFAAASFLLIAVIIMYGQNRELRQSGLGSTEDAIVVVANASQFTKVDPKLLRDELERLPQVVSVASTGREPWSQGVNLIPLARSPEETAAQRTANTNSVDYNYFSLMEMELLAGRTFGEEYADDRMPEGGIMALSEARPGHIVIDRAYAKDLGFATPEDAAGETIYVSARMARMLGRQDAQPLRILGVVENRPLQFYSSGAAGSIYFLNEDQTYVLARLKAGQVGEGVDAINRVWRELAPDNAISLKFMDAMFNQSFQLYGNVNNAFTGLSLFALVIASIGLFGMAIRVTGRRIREIGVRKTIGASAGQILRMLVVDFSKPVVIANVIAWPLGFMAGQVYLSFFIHRSALTPWPFVASLVFTLLIAWLAVGGQAWRAAQVQPAQVLKYE